MKNDGKLIIALSRTLQHVHQKSEILFREEGITFTQFMVLEVLYHKQECTIKTIIDSILSSSGNMSVVLRNLEKKKRIERKVNTYDKRSSLICLTPLGKTLITRLYTSHMQYVEEALQPLTSEEKTMIIQTLKKCDKPS